VSLARTLVLLAVAGLSAGYVDSRRRTDPGLRGEALQSAHDQLHARLASGIERDPVAARASADPGQIVIAVRSALVEDLTARTARQYLQQVSLDLTAVKAHAGGELRRKTLIGRRKMGVWDVNVVIGSLLGHLQVGPPRVAFARNVLDVELPLEVQAVAIPVELHFAWNSKGLADLVCQDFQLDLPLEGRAARQHHVLKGRIELAAGPLGLSAMPVVPDRSFRLQLELTPDSWTRVRVALRSQDTFSRCGLFLEPEDVLQELRRLVAKGIRVRLPAKIFRRIALPAGFEQEVTVGDRVVRLSLADQKLFSSDAMLWASARVQVARAP
jgi:hypothetical protein